MQMNRSTRFLAVCAGILFLYLATGVRSALAYRPFDGTDAGVAEAGEIELEFGPVGYLREGSARSLIGPAVVANWGISQDREIVLEGKLKTLRNSSPEGHGTSLEDTAISLKQLHRSGNLQDGTGPSIASECGVLLPTIHGESGTGASCAGIVSQRWPMATIHLNTALVLDRQHHWNRILGGIVEGPYEWSVRPVLEVFGERSASGSRTNSALIGLIWRARENLSFDVGVRTARSDSSNAYEFRAGLTWGFNLGK